jgi:hypothetical protein
MNQMTRALLALVALLGLSGDAAAACRFEDWRGATLQDVTDRAAREKRLVVLVVSQPDWCPPCIRLDRKWLKNAQDTEVSTITKDAIVLEANGYDEPDASILRRHRIAFRGTPTTYVFAPSAEHRLLGDAPLRGSIIGAPDDFPARLASIIDGHDPIEELERKIDEQGHEDKIQRAKDLLELGDLYAARGDRASTYLCYRHVRRIQYGTLPAEQAAELKELKREAAWRQADTSMLRVNKNYSEALEDVVAYENGFRRRQDEKARTAYAKAWAMANDGDVPGALRVLENGLTDDADGAETFLYFCFRTGDRTALVAGERVAKEATWRWPERRATWLEGMGRIARRQGRYADAERAFAEAASLETDPEVKLVYEGQLDHVRGELAERQAAMEVSRHDDQDDEPIDGGDSRGASGSLGR